MRSAHKQFMHLGFGSKGWKGASFRVASSDKCLSAILSYALQTLGPSYSISISRAGSEHASLSGKCSCANQFSIILLFWMHFPAAFDQHRGNSSGKLRTPAEDLLRHWQKQLCYHWDMFMSSTVVWDLFYHITAWQSPSTCWHFTLDINFSIEGAGAWRDLSAGA